MLTLPDAVLVILVGMVLLGITCICYSYMIRKNQLGWRIQHTGSTPHEPFLEALAATAPRYNVKILTIMEHDIPKRQVYLQGLAADCKLLRDDLAMQGYWVTLQAI